MNVADPDSLSDLEWAMRVREMEYLLKKEREANRMS